jgi:hypothetical protein
MGNTYQSIIDVWRLFAAGKRALLSFMREAFVDAAPPDRSPLPCPG